LRRLIAIGAAAIVLVALATATETVASSAPRPQYYLSLGDSWAVGFQNGVAGGTETLHGYSNLVVSDVKAKRHLILENFGCNGAMASDLLNVNGCTTGGVALDAVPYPTITQLQAALDFIQIHHGQIGLITMSIGINDYYSNVPLPTITANIETIVKRLRGAVGGSVPIIGLGMDDASLAEWLSGGPDVRAAAASVRAVEYSANPAIKAGYINAGATFVNVGRIFDTYVPFSTQTDDPSHGEIPIAVFEICRLTSMCTAADDPHPNYTGYAIIAAQIAKAYLKLLRHP
jgi:lysophospholipase L1-like esterase